MNSTKANPNANRVGFFFVRCDSERVGQEQLARLSSNHLTNVQLAIILVPLKVER